MNCLTSQGREFRIDYHLQNGTKSYIHYNTFAIGSQYPLSISEMTNNGLSDPFHVYGHILDGMKFTTTGDRDNDLSTLSNCENNNGPWWHRHCGYMCLNRQYNRMNLPVSTGSAIYPIFIQMKFRPHNCNIR